MKKVITVSVEDGGVSVEITSGECSINEAMGALERAKLVLWATNTTTSKEEAE